MNIDFNNGPHRRREGEMSERPYPWHSGVFNPACVCGGSINRPNAHCERCAFHAWVYKQATEIERLRAERDECRRLLRFVCDHATRNAGTFKSPFTYLWQRDWDEFEQAARAAGGGDEG